MPLINYSPVDKCSSTPNPEDSTAAPGKWRTPVVEVNSLHELRAEKKRLLTMLHTMLHERDEALRRVAELEKTHYVSGNQKAVELIDRWCAEEGLYVSGNPPEDCREHCLAMCAMKAERDNALASCKQMADKWDALVAERDQAVSDRDGTRYALSNALTVNAGLMRERDEREHWAGVMYRRALVAERDLDWLRMVSWKCDHCGFEWKQSEGICPKCRSKI